jgi:hypothetical protein
LGISYVYLIGTFTPWHILAYICSIVPFFAILGIVMIPESPGVNFINILCTNFLYKSLFSSFSLVTCKKKKLPKILLDLKFACKTMTKLTTVWLMHKGRIEDSEKATKWLNGENPDKIVMLVFLYFCLKFSSIMAVLNSNTNYIA